MQSCHHKFKPEFVEGPYQLCNLDSETCDENCKLHIVRAEIAQLRDERNSLQNTCKQLKKGLAEYEEELVELEKNIEELEKIKEATTIN